MQSLLPLAARCATLLIARGNTIAIAESSAGGLISAALLAVPGASAYFRGGDVIYTQHARAAFGITPEMMVDMRASTEAYAQLLAETATARLDATWALAETGATGPSGNRYGDAPGHVCLAVAGPVSMSRTIETGHGDREANMRAFALGALTLLEEALTQAAP
jgi:PncC family amidohydrolase